MRSKSSFFINIINKKNRIIKNTGGLYLLLAIVMSLALIFNFIPDTIVLQTLFSDSASSTDGLQNIAYHELYSKLITQPTISLILLMIMFILIGFLIKVKGNPMPSFVLFLHTHITPYLVLLLFPYYILVILFSGFVIIIHYSIYLGILYIVTLMMLLFKNYNYLDKFFSYTIWFFLSGLSLMYLFIVVKTGNIYIITLYDILAIIGLLWVFSIFGSLFLFILLDPAYNKINKKIYKAVKFVVVAFIIFILSWYLMEQGYDYIYVILIISLLSIVSLTPYIVLDNIILKFIQDTNKKKENFFTISIAIILIKLRFILNIVLPDIFDIYSFIILFIFVSILSKLLDGKLTKVSFFIILLVCPLSILLFNIYIFPIFILPLLIYSFDVIGFIIGELVNYFGLSSIIHFFSQIITFLDQVLKNGVAYCEGPNRDEYITLLGMDYKEKGIPDRFFFVTRNIVNNSFNNDVFYPYIGSLQTNFSAQDISNLASQYMTTKRHLTRNTEDYFYLFKILYEYKHIKLRMGIPGNNSPTLLEDFVSNYNSKYKEFMYLGWYSERPAHWYKTDHGKLEDFSKIIGNHMEFALKRQEADRRIIAHLLSIQAESNFLVESQGLPKLVEDSDGHWQRTYFESSKRVYESLESFAYIQVKNGIFRDKKEILNNNDIISILKQQKDTDGNTFYSKIVALANEEQDLIANKNWEKNKKKLLEFPSGLIIKIKTEINKSK